MEKDSLPKLKIEGFKNVVKSPGRALWKERAAGIAQKISIKRIRRSGGAAKEQKNQQDVDAGYKRLLIKTGVCAAIAIIILMISNINTPTANNVTQAIDYAVNHEFDIEEDIGRLKFVQSLDEEIQSVFSPLPEAAVVFPADGDVVTSFGEGGSKGVRIAPTGKEIVCIAKGTVISVGTIDDKGYVRVKLDTGLTAVFHNISPIVLVDDIVFPGQPIGDIADEYLYLEMKDGEEYIDPIAYIQKRSAMVLQ